MSKIKYNSRQIPDILADPGDPDISRTLFTNGRQSYARQRVNPNKKEYTSLYNIVWIKYTFWHIIYRIFPYNFLKGAVFRQEFVFLDRATDKVFKRYQLSHFSTKPYGETTHWNRKAERNLESCYLYSLEYCRVL